MTAVLDSRLRLLSLRLLDASNRNAQSITVREILRRLPPERFCATGFCEEAADPILASCRHVRVHRLPAKLRSAYVVARARVEGAEVLFHPQPDRYDRRIERWLSWTGQSPRLVVHVVLDVTSPLASPRYLEHVADHVRRASLLTANSEYIAEGVERRFGRRPHVVENGVDLAVFQPRPGPRPLDAPPRVAVVASFQRRKRHDLVLEAAARLPEVSFWCAGGGEDLARKEFQDRVRDRELRNVEVCGVISPTMLAERLAASDVLFHPSDHEGAPQVILQAQACGCVPIARATYRPPTVTDGASGLLARDDGDLVEALVTTLSDAALRSRLARGGRVEASQRSWDVVASRWTGLLEALAYTSTHGPSRRSV